MYFELWDRARPRRLGRFQTQDAALSAARGYLLPKRSDGDALLLELLEMEGWRRGRTVAIGTALEALALGASQGPVAGATRA